MITPTHGRYVVVVYWMTWFLLVVFLFIVKKRDAWYVVSDFLLFRFVLVLMGTTLALVSPNVCTYPPSCRARCRGPRAPHFPIICYAEFVTLNVRIPLEYIPLRNFCKTAVSNEPPANPCKLREKRIRTKKSFFIAFWLTLSIFSSWWTHKFKYSNKRTDLGLFLQAMASNNGQRSPESLLQDPSCKARVLAISDNHVAILVTRGDDDEERSFSLNLSWIYCRRFIIGNRSFAEISKRYSTREEYVRSELRILHNIWWESEARAGCRTSTASSLQLKFPGSRQPNTQILCFGTNSR